MTDFYRFPAMAKLKEFTDRQQVNYILEEVEEAIAALHEAERTTDWGKQVEYGMELMDVIHSAETALRMRFRDDEIAYLQKRVIEKNFGRGYYDVLRA